MLKIINKTRLVIQSAFKFFCIRATNLFKFSSFKNSKNINIGFKPILIIPHLASKGVNSFPSAKEFKEIIARYEAHAKAAKKYPQSIRCIKVSSDEIKIHKKPFLFKLYHKGEK